MKRSMKPASASMRAAPKSAIQQLIDSKPDGAKVDRFLEGRAVPIVEGPAVTFVWRGEANGVSLRHWIFGLESGSALARIPNTDLWYLTLDIPHGSRVEYKFEVHRADRSEWIEDPLNPNRARDPFGANSVLQGEGYEVPDWVRPDPTSRPRAPRALRIPQQGVRRDARRAHLPARRGSARRAAIRCSWCTTAGTT